MKSHRIFVPLLFLALLGSCQKASDSASNGINAPNSVSGGSSSSSALVTGVTGDDEVVQDDSVDNYLTSEVETALGEDAALPESYTTVTEAESSITAPGAYYFKGDSFVSVNVALTEKGEVLLYLDGATFTASGKIISVDDDYTEAVKIILLNGSTNTLTTTKKNAVDSTADLYVLGSGTLNISSAGKSCLKSDQAVYVKDVTLNLTASADGDGHGISGSKVLAEGATIHVLDAGKTASMRKWTIPSAPLRRRTDMLF